MSKILRPGTQDWKWLLPYKNILVSLLEKQDFYDVVRDVLKENTQLGHTSPAGKSSKNSSSTKSEPLYHQLEDRTNLTYESSDKLRLVRRDEVDVHRIPSARSDSAEGEYTSLGSQTSSSAKENSIYEPLALKQTNTSSYKDGEQLEEYCLPCEATSTGSSATGSTATGIIRGESCSLYESTNRYAGTGGRSSAQQPKNIDVLGEYCEPYEQPLTILK